MAKVGCAPLEESTLSVHSAFYGVKPSLSSPSSDTAPLPGGALPKSWRDLSETSTASTIAYDVSGPSTIAYSSASAHQLGGRALGEAGGGNESEMLRTYLSVESWGRCASEHGMAGYGAGSHAHDRVEARREVLKRSHQPSQVAQIVPWKVFDFTLDRGRIRP